MFAGFEILKLIFHQYEVPFAHMIGFEWRNGIKNAYES